MHELSVCQSILDQVTQLARAHGARAVSRIKVLVGPLSGVEPGLLVQAFPIARAGTLAETANLAVETPPLRVRCRSCGALSDAQANRLVCAACGDWHTDIDSGDELVLASVELITEECERV